MVRAIRIGLMAGLIVMGWPAGLSGQIPVEGTVTDFGSGERVPYAHITVTGKGAGTATNGDGEFTLVLDALPETLRVSHIGYIDRKIPLKARQNRNLEITLKPALLESDSVVVTDRYEITLVERAIDSLRARDRDLFGRAFYRQLTRSDSVYTEFMELFYNTKLTANGIDKWRIEQGRYAVTPFDSLESRIYNANFSSFSRLELVDEKPYRTSFIWPLRRDTGSHYRFYLRNRYSDGGSSYAELHFEPQKELNRPGFTGSVVISTDTYAIRKLDARISDPRFNPVQFATGRRSSQHTVLTVGMEWMPEERVGYYPRLITVSLSYDYLKKKGLFGKLAFNRSVETRSVLFFYEYDRGGLTRYLSEASFEEGESSVSDYRLINKAGYDRDFWENNPVIKRTPVEQQVINSFEQYGAHGTMFEAPPGGQ